MNVTEFFFSSLAPSHKKWFFLFRWSANKICSNCIFVIIIIEKFSASGKKKVFDSMKVFLCLSVCLSEWVNHKSPTLVIQPCESSHCKYRNEREKTVKFNERDAEKSFMHCDLWIVKNDKFRIQTLIDEDGDVVINLQTDKKRRIIFVWKKTKKMNRMDVCLYFIHKQLSPNCVYNISDQIQSLNLAKVKKPEYFSTRERKKIVNQTVHSLKWYYTQFIWSMLDRSITR